MNFTDMVQSRKRHQPRWWRLGLIIGIIVPSIASLHGAEDKGIEPMTAIRAALDDQLYDLTLRRLQSHFETLSPDHHDYGDALVMLAEAAHELGLHTMMVERLKDLPESLNETQAAELLFWRALSHYHLNQQNHAVELTEQFEQRFREGVRMPDILRLRAAALTATSALPKALAAFEAFDELYPDDPEADGNRLAWAQALLMSDRPEDAMPLLTGLAEDPATSSGREAAYWLGRMALEAGNFEEAEARFEALLAAPDIHPAVAARYNLAMAELREQQDEPHAALEMLQSAIEGLPAGNSRRQAKIDATRLLFEIGQADPAADQLREIIHAAPQRDDVPLLQLGLANGLLRNQQYERAADEFQTYLEAFTNRTGQAQALMGLGWSLIGLERQAEAAESFEKAARQTDDPVQRTDALMKAGDAWFLHERFGAALDRYQRAANAAMDLNDIDLHAQARYLAATCLIHLDQPYDAIAMLQELADQMADHPYSGKALLRIAKLHEQRGALPEALRTYERLLESVTDPSLLADTLLSSGILRYQMFRFDDALEAFSMLVTRLPDHHFAERARFMKVWAHSMMGNEMLAMAAANAFIEHHPDSSRVAEILFRIAEHEFNHDRMDAAKKMFLDLLEKHPDSSVADNALLWAGRAAVRRKNFRTAIDLFSRLAREYPDSPRVADARFSAADAFSELGEFAEAILLFDEVINRFPDSYLLPAAMGRKGDCQFLLGNTDPQRYLEAIESYRALLGMPTAAPDMRVQALYKIGRCHDHLENRDLALDHFHQALISYDEMVKSGIRPTPSAVWWFQRAALDAAAIMESREQWRQAVHLLQRIVDARTPAAEQAREHIARLRADHWLLYY